MELRAIIMPLSDRERGMLLGRRSAVREGAIARGLEKYLPPPPPVEQDPTLTYVTEREKKRLKRQLRNPGPASNRGKLRGSIGASSATKEEESS